jgi:hypothetical protein
MRRLKVVVAALASFATDFLSATPTNYQGEAMSFAGSSSVITAYVANNASNQLLLASSKDGITWTASTLVPGQSSKTAPAFGENPGFGVYMGYVANNDSRDLLTTRAIDNWTGSSRVDGQSSKTAPALAGFRGKLVMAYVANNDRNDLLTAELSSFIDAPSKWTGSRRVQGQSSKTAPALAVFQNQLVLAYVANNDRNDLLTASSTDGVNWTGSRAVQGQSSQTAPALTAATDRSDGVRNQLVLAYVANNDRNDLLTASSTDGVNWTGSRAVQGQSSQTAPTLFFMFSPPIS